MGTMASKITSLTIVYTTVYSGADQSKHQSSVSLAFVWGIHRGPVNSPHKWPVTRKMFPFDDVIMIDNNIVSWNRYSTPLPMIVNMRPLLSFYNYNARRYVSRHTAWRVLLLLVSQIHVQTLELESVLNLNWIVFIRQKQIQTWNNVTEQYIRGCFMSGDPYKGSERTAGVRATHKYNNAWTGTIAHEVLIF